MPARSIVACAFDVESGKLHRQRLTPNVEDLQRWLTALPAPVAVTYEAGPTGFGLAMTLTAAGARCVVGAPPKLQRPAGDRVKIDARDAEHLARLLRMDQVVAVRVPSADEEAARDLVRAREDARSDLMGNQHRLSKLLLRQGIVWSGGAAWTGRHEVWLREQHFDRVGLRLAFDADLPGDADGFGAAGSVGQSHRGDGHGQVSSPRWSASCAVCGECRR